MPPRPRILTSTITAVPGEIVTVPDPSRMTTEQLSLAVQALREVLEARLEGMDTATKLLATHINRVPSDIDRQVEQLTNLFGERMNGLRSELIALSRGIQLQFDERDIRSRASEDAAKVAVNAALQAQKEAAAAQNESNAAAITKSEGATVKQIDGILALLGSNTQAINDKIAGIISRLDRGEAIITGAQVQNREHREVQGSNISVVMGVIAVITVCVTLLGFFFIHTATPIYSGPAQQYQAPHP